MKIRVSYSELKTVPGFNNCRAEAEVEMETNELEMVKDFENAWEICRQQVKEQLYPETIEITRPVFSNDDELPF